MKVQIFSDIHVEGISGRYDLLWEQIQPQAPVAIVAGDIDTRDFEGTLTEIASKFEHVFAVYGNHEFYHRDVSWRADPAKLPENVTILDRSVKEYEGKLFMGCTLWTDFKNQDWFIMHRADDGINDFHVITEDNGGRRFTANRAWEKHVQEKAWLKKMIEQNRDKEIVIVTHFIPSYALVHEKWKGGGTDSLNYYFSAGCDDLIETCEAKAWVFGHTHDRREMEIAGVPFYCNPLGYGAGRENHYTYKDMIIEV